LKGRYDPQNSPENPPIACEFGEFKLKQGFEWMVEDHKIIFSDWVIGDAKLLLNQGYEKHRVSRVGESGSRMVYFPQGYLQDKLVDIPQIGKMTVDHYCSVVQLAELAQEYNADEIFINHNASMDLKLRFGAFTVGLEFEEARNHLLLGS